MKTFASMEEWHVFRDEIRQRPIGFVPTMGALHRGHLSLVEASLENNAVTVASLFVNPKQFNDPSDFAAYPTDQQADLAAFEQVGVDVVIMPDDAQMYPDNYRYKVIENEYSKRFEGAQRPGHFDGVLTVVMKLLNLVRPDNAYFGEKDYQQLRLVREMATAFFIPVNIIACPTVREADGLAMSSRNRRLDDLQRKLAPSLYAALKHCRTAREARETLAGQGFKVEYVEDVGDRRLAAVKLGNTRLIDNVQI